MATLRFLCLAILLGTSAAQGADSGATAAQQGNNNASDALKQAIGNDPLTPNELLNVCQPKGATWDQCFKAAQGNNVLKMPDPSKPKQLCILGGGTLTYCFPEAELTPPKPSNALGRWDWLTPRALWTKGPYELLTSGDRGRAVSPTR